VLIIMSNQTQIKKKKSKKQQEEEENEKAQRIAQLRENWYTASYRRKIIMDKILDYSSDVSRLLGVEKNDPIAREIGRECRLALRREIRPEHSNNNSSGFILIREKEAVKSLFTFDDEQEQEDLVQKRRRLSAKR
jgi:hypothetical protein